MKISSFNNPHLSKGFLEGETKYFKEGQIVVGEILEIKNGEALIDFPEYGKVKVLLDSKLEEFISEKVSFYVKSSTIHEVQLKPLPDVENQETNLNSGNISKEDIYMAKTLEGFGIKGDSRAIEYVKALINYNVSLNEESVLNGLQILDKLDKLITSKGDSYNFINLKGDKSLENEDLKNIIIEYRTEATDSTYGTREENTNIDPLERDVDQDKDILKFYSSIRELKDLTQNIESFKSDLVKLLAIFTKYKIKASLNNINKFFLIKESPENFFANFKLSDEIENKDNNFKKINKSTIIKNENLKELIMKNHKEYKKFINTIEENLRNNKDFFTSIGKRELELLEEKLYFLKEINQEFNYSYIPFSFHKEINPSFITLLEEKRKKRNRNSNINVLINLNTDYLGNVAINCQIIDETINIKFYGLTKEGKSLFKSNEATLRHLVSTTGYSIGKINYELEYNNDILDWLVVNKSSVYYLNVEA